MCLMKGRNEIINQIEILIFLCFIASFLHYSLYLLFLLMIAMFATQNILWCVKGMIWISLRTIINYSIATPGNGVVQIVKWIVIFELAFILLFFYKDKAIRWKKVAMSHVVAWLALFMVYVFGQSILYSGYPIASVFKMMSFGIVFVAAIKGVAIEKYNGMWSKYLYSCLKMIMILSIIIFPIRAYSFSSAGLFQGITNQSNMFGVMACLFFALFYYNLYMNRCNSWDIALSGIALVLLILSQSRNGVLGVIILTVTYLVVCKQTIRTKIFILIILIIVIAIFLASNQELRTDILRFIYKSDDLSAIMSGERELFSSRRIQKDLFALKYSTNKWFGTGFAVPYNAENQDWGFYMSLITEPGNLGYAVLGDVGIVGAVLFSAIYICIFRFRASKGSLILFLAPFLVSIGEMVFFSTNNMAMLLYIIFGIVINEKEFID